MSTDIRHMKAFSAVARCGNFTRAADELHICQPALTVQIKQLEHSLGVRLFDRDKRHVALTQAGRDLLRPIEQVLADIDAIQTSSHEFATYRRGVVTVAALPSIAANVMPPAIKRLNVSYPGISVRLNELIGTRIIDVVKAGEADFGVGSYAKIDRELSYQHLWSDRMAAFVPATHLLAKRRAVSFRDVVTYPLVLTRQGSSVRVLVDRILERERLAANVVQEASYVPTILGMVEAGLGLAILPERELPAGRAETIRRLPIRAPALIRHIGIIGVAARSLSPAALKLIEVLRESLKQSGEADRRRAAS
jgi:LysR family carnitine catabolism transcriptional activator